MHETEWDVLWLLIGAAVWAVEHPVEVALTLTVSAAVGFTAWKWRK